MRKDTHMNEYQHMLGCEFDYLIHGKTIKCFIAAIDHHSGLTVKSLDDSEDRICNHTRHISFNSKTGKYKRKEFRYFVKRIAEGQLKAFSVPYETPYEMVGGRAPCVFG